jgi:hypothetical protein
VFAFAELLAAGAAVFVLPLEFILKVSSGSWLTCNARMYATTAHRSVAESLSA